MPFKLFEMDEDYCTVVAAEDKQQAIDFYNSTDDYMDPVKEAKEVSFEEKSRFEDEPLVVQTWREHLSDFEYKGPQIVGWRD